MFSPSLFSVTLTDALRLLHLCCKNALEQLQLHRRQIVVGRRGRVGGG